MIVKTVFLICQSQGPDAISSVFLSNTEPFQFSSGLNKKLHFHLLKFPHPENKLPGNNLIPECFADLGNTKWNFHPSCFLDIKKIYKDSLGSFRTQIDFIGILLTLNPFG